jgi:hypothetical protein
MRLPILTYCIIIFVIVFSSCNNSTTKCEYVKEWTVNDYRIVESQCPDLVLSHFYEYSIYMGNKKIGNATAYNNDSCIFTCQADNENYLAINVCENTIQKFKPNKISLDTKSIDSITMFSSELIVTKSLNKQQIEKFVTDWNKSKSIKYSKESPDSAFYPMYQYKLTIFIGGNQKYFYGYNYLIIDTSKWQYEMSTKGDLDYFHKFWRK